MVLHFKELSRDQKNFNMHFKHWKSQRSYSEGSGLVESSPQIQKNMFYIITVIKHNLGINSYSRFADI